MRHCFVWFVVIGLCCSFLGCGSGAAGEGSTHGAFDSGGGGQSDARLGGGDAQRLGHRDGSVGPSCTPKTCAELGAACGPQNDGCNNVLQCGTCTAPETCGGGGVPNHCGGSSTDGGDASAIPMGTLTIAPLNQTINVTYGSLAPTVTYHAKVGSTSVAASFSIDLGQVASIDPSTGILIPSGHIGGVANVTATFGSQTATTPITVVIELVQNGAPAVPDGGVDAGNGAGGNAGVGGSPAGGPVSMATQTVLEGSPTTDTGLAWLYPYDKTVWPQGVLAPLLQWSAPRNYDSIYIQLHENGFSYQGFFSAPVAGQPFINIPLLQSAWDTLLYSNGGQSDPVTVTLVFSAGGVAYGPLTETWVVAQGTLTGTVYYNSYGTSLAINYSGPYGTFGGATLAIKHGATSPGLVAGSNGGTAQCRVCHSVAAGGSQLVTEHGDNYNESSAYALTSGNAETVMNAGASKGTFAFPAISPDGMFLFSNAGPMPGVNPPATSGLYDVPTGTLIPSTGLPAGLAAAVPAFSPDGKHIAFNDYSLDQRSISSVDFIQATSVFSNYQVLHTPAAGTPDLFPAFLPTNDAVIYEHQVAAPNPNEFGATRDGARGELWWVDLATHTAAPLANLNGVGYLPTGPNNHGAGGAMPNDTTLQYEPTVNPVPSGGYAWVVFTSRRLYGNVATQDPFLSDPRNYNAKLSATTKKLWVAAIDLNAPPGTDPSHPAFYLPAQELLAGNSRGYWVVDPCEGNGSSCLTGDQCCSGYCGQGDGGFVCGVQPPGCAVLGNKCMVSTDCCGDSTGIACIDGFCALPGHSGDAGSCTPTTCSKLGIDCGPAGDGCGGLLECGTCVAPKTCGGGGTSGVCAAPSGPP